MEKTYDIDPLSAAEVEEVLTAWRVVTQEVILLYSVDAVDEAVDAANEGITPLAERYGGLALVIGPLVSAMGVTAAAVTEGRRLEGVREQIQTTPLLAAGERRAMALEVLQVVLASGVDATGYPVVEVLDRAFAQLGADLSLVLEVVWLAVCAVAGRSGVLLGSWDDDDPHDEEDGLW